MKAKHTKLKKSIFLILICISLTTTFVVSASADFFPDRYLEIYLDDGSGNLSLYYRSLLAYDPSINYNLQLFYFTFIADASLIDPSISGPVCQFAIEYGSGSLYDNFENLTVFYQIDSIFINDIEFFIDYEPLSGDYVGFYQGVISYSSSDSGDVIVVIPSESSADSSPSFLDRVTSGLTSSLSWVGQVFESLTTGPIRPLLECFAVTISVSAVLLGIYSIRRFIWGS